MILTAFSISEENFRRMGSPESCCFGGCQAEAAPGWSHREPVFLEERWSRLEAGQGGCRPAEPWACQAHGGRMPRRAVPLPQLSDTMGVTDTANSCPELCREAACLHCLQLSYSTYLLLQSFKMYVTVVRCDVRRGEGLCLICLSLLWCQPGLWWLHKKLSPPECSTAAWQKISWHNWFPLQTWNF